MYSCNLTIFSLLIYIGSYAQIKPRIIAPNLTDAAINTYTTNDFDHYVYVSDSAPKRNQLFVFLTGTGGKGGTAPEFNITAAQAGYYVINLIYPDSIALYKICKNNLDRACYDNAHEEIISGIDVSDDLDITRPNSIENRLIKLLQYLHFNYPKENWQQFFSKNNILWGKIAIGGQSQGGGHAGYIAMKHKVSRVLMFGSPKDFGDVYKKPAPWIFAKSKTPLNRYFAFVHTDDTAGSTFEEWVEICKTIGIDKAGRLVDVDKESFPFKHTHTLTATKPSTNPATNPHNAPVRDVNSYKQVWQYMLSSEIK